MDEMIEEQTEQVQEPMAQEQAETPTKQARDQIGSTVPENLQEAFDRVVLAGMKIMFSKETHELSMAALEGDGPLPDRLAKGIAALMAELWDTSNGTIPPEVIIPSATTLLTHAIDFVEGSGETEPDLFANTMLKLVPTVMEAFGADPQQVAQMFGGGFSQENIEAPPQSPQGQGIVAQSMGA